MIECGTQEKFKCCAVLIHCFGCINIVCFLLLIFSRVLKTVVDVFQCQHAPGHLVGLLQIVVTTSIDISIRQVASIQFKNVVGKHWSNDTRYDFHLFFHILSNNLKLILIFLVLLLLSVVQISQSDRNAVREHLLEALVHAPPIIR